MPKSKRRPVLPGLSHLMFAFLVSLLVGSVVTSAVAADPLQKQAVQSALLAEDWTKVIDLLGPDSLLDSYPLARLVKGHACLALNRNNESLCLFSSVTSENNLNDWATWTREFVEKNPERAIACYLHGDALARRQQWNDAVTALDQGLVDRRDHALLWLARGVVLAAKGDWDSSLVSLIMATIHGDSLAEAHASLGAHWIQRKNGAPGAFASCSTSLDLVPNYALALNGRGCAQFALGNWEEAKSDFEQAAQQSDCLDIVEPNLVELHLAWLKVMDELVAMLAEDTAGMPIDQRTHIMDLRNDNLSSMHDVQSVRDANWRIHNLWKPFWHTFQGVPFVGGIGSGMIDKLDHRIDVNSQYIRQATGGVDTESIRRAFVDEGNWLLTWSGLAYQVEPVALTRPPGDDTK